MDERVASVHQVFSGPVAGDALLLLDPIAAATLTELLTDVRSLSLDLDPSTREVFTEVGNVVLNACIGTFGNMLRCADVVLGPGCRRQQRDNRHRPDGGDRRCAALCPGGDRRLPAARIGGDRVRGDRADRAVAQTAPRRAGSLAERFKREHDGPGTFDDRYGGSRNAAMVRGTCRPRRVHDRSRSDYSQLEPVARDRHWLRG